MWEARCKDLAVSASTDTRNDAAIYADLKQETSKRLPCENPNHEISVPLRKWVLSELLSNLGQEVQDTCT